MARALAVAAVCGVMVLGSGCAAIISGSTQSVAIMPMQGGQFDATATCTATNRKGSWVAPGGGSVVVKKARDDLQVRCVDTETQQVGLQGAPRVTQVGFAIADFLLWDFCTISCLIDFNSGAIYEYPSQVQVTMPPALQPVIPMQAPADAGQASAEAVSGGVSAAPAAPAVQAIAPEAVSAADAQVVF